MRIQIFLLLVLALSACEHKSAQQESFIHAPCEIALVPADDAEISKLQAKVREANEPISFLERLGWAYIAKARTSFDAGYYKFAEQTALCMEDKAPGNLAGLLLRGHVLHSLHKFKEGEVVARELVAKRGLWLDYALLGDVLMEQGRLDEAVPAYQAMVDQRPGPQAYSRVAHVRWLKGDLTGAIETMQMAADASDGEERAWYRTRLALYEMQAGNFERAAQLAALPDYPPALLARGRILLAQGQPAAAIEPLKHAAEATQLPEYLWTLEEAQRAAGQASDARVTEEILKQRGAQEDPRTFALYLATRGEDAGTALRLANAELGTRSDVFTFDALAWALHAAGRDCEARAAMQRALAEGTQDARLALHATVILGQPMNVRPELLLPSERKFLAANPVLISQRSDFETTQQQTKE